jgi:hypothetical protein
MALFKRSPKLGPLLMAIWLIAHGVLGLVQIGIPLLPQVMAALAIAAGVFLLIDR